MRRRNLRLSQCSNVGMDCRKAYSKRIPVMASLWSTYGLVKGTVVKRKWRTHRASDHLLCDSNGYVCTLLCIGRLGYTWTCTFTQKAQRCCDTGRIFLCDMDFSDAYVLEFRGDIVCAMVSRVDAENRRYRLCANKLERRERSWLEFWRCPAATLHSIWFVTRIPGRLWIFQQDHFSCFLIDTRHTIAATSFQKVGVWPLSLPSLANNSQTFSVDCNSCFDNFLAICCYCNRYSLLHRPSRHNLLLSTVQIYQYRSNRYTNQ